MSYTALCLILNCSVLRLLWASVRLWGVLGVTLCSCLGSIPRLKFMFDVSFQSLDFWFGWVRGLVVAKKSQTLAVAQRRTIEQACLASPHLLLAVLGLPPQSPEPSHRIRPSVHLNQYCQLRLAVASLRGFVFRLISNWRRCWELKLPGPCVLLVS